MRAPKAPRGAKPPSLHNGGTIRPAKPAAPGAKLIQHYVTQDNIQNVYSNVFGEYKNRFRRTLDSRFSDFPQKNQRIFRRIISPKSILRFPFLKSFRLFISLFFCAKVCYKVLLFTKRFRRTKHYQIVCITQSDHCLS